MFFGGGINGKISHFFVERIDEDIDSRIVFTAEKWHFGDFDKKFVFFSSHLSTLID